MQGVAILSFHALEIGPHHVVGLAGGKPLGEFACMVGIELPLGLFVRHAADLDLHAVEGAIVRSPDRSENESIAICRFQLLGRGSCEGWRQDARAQGSEKENNQQAERGEARKQKSTGGFTSRHRLRFPLLRPLPRSRPRPPSTPADWSSPPRSPCRTRGKRRSRPRRPLLLPHPDSFHIRDKEP